MFDKEKIRYLKKTLRHLKKYKTWSVCVLIFSFFSSFFESFSIGTLVPLFQSMTTPALGVNAIEIPLLGKYVLQYSKHPYFILYVLFGILILVVLKNIFFYLNTIFINKITNFIKRDLQTDLFNQVADANIGFFNSIKSSHLIGTISTYAESIASFIFSFLNIFIIITRALFYIALLLLISWKVTIVFLIFGSLFLPLLRFLLIKIRKISLKTTLEISKLYFRLSEIFNNISLIKIFSTEEYEKNRFKETATALANNSYHISIFSNILTPFAEIVLTVVIFTITVYVILIQKIPFAPYFPFVIAYAYIFLRFYSQLSTFFALLTKMFQGVEPFREYEKVIIKSNKLKSPIGLVYFDKLSTGINFQNVSFAYSTETVVLNNITIHIKAGSFVAFVGATGSGKTSIVNLIMGLYLPTSGVITIDNSTITDLDLHKWRKKIGYVSQDVALFNDTIENNIKYGNFEATRDQVTKAAKAAHIHEFILELPIGYDTVVGERGIRLSGGQKQRLSIARALIHNPEILIFDEATSALDTETERKIHDSITKAMQGVTLIAIAHRLSTIQNADTIFVLKKGSIIEQGNHQELITHGGYYKHLYELQSS